MKSENIVCEEWKGYRPNMPVKVVGVSNGKITSNGNGVEIFKNLKDAQKKYSDLDPEENTKRFTWVMYDEIKGRDGDDLKLGKQKECILWKNKYFKIQ